MSTRGSLLVLTAVIAGSVPFFSPVAAAAAGRSLTAVANPATRSFYATAPPGGSVAIWTPPSMVWGQAGGFTFRTDWVASYVGPNWVMSPPLISAPNSGSASPQVRSLSASAVVWPSATGARPPFFDFDLRPLQITGTGYAYEVTAAAPIGLGCQVGGRARQGFGVGPLVEQSLSGRQVAVSLSWMPLNHESIWNGQPFFNPRSGYVAVRAIF